MLPLDRLALAMTLQAQSYNLLRWVASAVGQGFISGRRAHEYANTAEAALEWIDEHYLNLPQDARPKKQQMREFASFFASYLTTSFDIVEQPGKRRETRCGCYCDMCSRLVNASHLRTKRVTGADKKRARVLKEDRVVALGQEVGIIVDARVATEIAQAELTSRAAALSAYGLSLVQRIEGYSDGTSILALWREFAWKPTGSPIPAFTLTISGFIEAESLIVSTLQARRKKGEPAA
jgi:hypothetical protein